ncbi:transcription factor HES-5-like [Sphaeramia orbicularis]|uniref:transcription factor HES-5-like n=1 Tax=Sphaeramia orbicularis TaxID=375764 RepID=UPI001180C460|nr:transcription factor HES-5-like [Sphaeramia orbicularis]
MKLSQDSQDAKAKRKMLKPQVERRRRERMNRSLENLRTLLFQGQEHPRRRMEKAEILEHTVLFLQNTVQRAQSRPGGDHQHSFQHGYSACMQRATQFLGPHGNGVCLGAALNATLSARFAGSSDSDPAGVHVSPGAGPSSSLIHRKSSRSVVRMLLQRYRLNRPVLTVRSSIHTHTGPRSPPTNQQQKSVSPTQNQTVGQSLWRPWPCSV